MIREILTFRPIDQLQIFLFILFALYIIICIVLTELPAASNAFQRFLIAASAWLESTAARIRDDEPFDRQWMDYQKWKETRP